MRRTFPHFPGSLGLALGLALTLGPSALGQTPEPTSKSLARYVPKDDVVMYLEFDGLDAHADAWKKTAAYKILNVTPAGEMIRDVFTQLLEKGKVPGGGRTVALLEHMAKAGFVVAAGGRMETQQPFYVVLAIRGAFVNKEIRASTAQALSSLNAPDTKFQATTRVGHKIYSGKMVGGRVFSWWVEETQKEDVVVVFPSLESTDLILETLDGKHPNSVDHPLRAGLNQAENGFEPAAFAFVNPRAKGFQNTPQVGLAAATRIDLRWGFQDTALQTVIRVATPAPHQGALAFLDGPTFNKSSLPPIPESVSGFTVTSLDTRSTFDQIIAAASAASPDAAGRINAALGTIQGKGKMRLRDDILGHLGPRMAFYALPARSSDSNASTPPALAAMMGMAGMASVPRGVALFEVDDPVAFGKSLDELMVVVNRELKANLTPPREKEAPPDRDAPPRGRGPAGPAPEFRLSPGTPKTYIFSVPPELSKTYPPSIRPSIRVGAKHVVIAMTADVAREALEPKGLWSAPIELTSVFNALPEKMKMLHVGDQRAAIASTLASLPGKIQILINSPLFNPQAAPAPGASPNPDGGIKIGGGRGGEFTVQGGAMSAASGAPAGAVQGAPASGGADASKPGASGPIVLQIAPGKLPSAETVKGMLFPSVTLLEVNPEEIKFTSRVAFPDISGLSYAPAAALLGTSMRGGAIVAPTGAPAGGPTVPGAVSGEGSARDR